MFIGGFVSLIALIWMVARIWKESVLLAVLGFFFWPVLVFALFKYWGDEESDIKVPFLICLVATIYAWYDMLKMAKALAVEQQESLLAILPLFA